MRTIWLVIKHDLLKTLRQRSFWIMTFLMPGFLLAFNAYYLIQESEPSTGSGQPEAEAGQTVAPPIIGLVDEAGILSEWPAGIPVDLFRRFPDQASAGLALEAEEIVQYIHMPADFVTTGQIAVYAKDFQILQGDANAGVGFGGASEAMLEHLIAYNLSGDEQLALALQNPTPGRLAAYHALRPADNVAAESQDLAELVSSLVPYVFYFLLVIGSSYMMQSVVAEKENRTVEVLLLSVQPRQMMIGKILAMSIVVLIQLAIWIGGGALALNRGAGLLNVAEYVFPPGFVVWSTLFLLSGYLLYASLMAAAGAISNNAREAGQMTFVLILPLMPTLMFARLFFDQPDSPLVLALSLFPFSAPAAMVTRLALVEVPTWQLLVSLAGVALTAYLFVVLAARFFKAGNLLSEASFSWKRLATAWRK